MRYCAKCAEVTPQDRHVFDGFEQIDEALNGAHTAERIVSVCERQRERRTDLSESVNQRFPPPGQPRGVQCEREATALPFDPLLLGFDRRSQPIEA